MPFLHEFGADDIFQNNLETSPGKKFTAYSGSLYIDESRFKGQNIGTGSMSLYEVNVDRTAISGTSVARAATGSITFQAATAANLHSGTIILRDQGGVAVVFQYDTNHAHNNPIYYNNITASDGSSISPVLLEGYKAIAQFKVGAQGGYSTADEHATAFLNAVNLANGTDTQSTANPGISPLGGRFPILGIKVSRDGGVVNLTQDIDKYSRRPPGGSNPAPSKSGIKGNTPIIVANTGSSIIEGKATEVGFGGGSAEPNTYAYVIKDGTNMSFKSITTGTYSQEDYGTKITGAYPLTSSIDRQYIYGDRVYYGDSVRKVRGEPVLVDPNTTDLYFSQSKNLLSLRSTIEKYRRFTPLYTFSGSKTVDPTIPPFLTGAINLISIPSIFYGSTIEKGSVDLEFYYTGTLMDRCRDEKRNGELISTQPGSMVSGSTVGLVLYDEGFILLYNEVPINGDADILDSYSATGSDGAGLGLRPNWTYFWSYNTGSSGSQGIAAADGVDHAPGGATRTDTNYGYFPSSSHFVMNFRGKNTIPTMTMFAHAPAGKLNNSLNPTWISSSYSNWKELVHFDSSSYVEPKEVAIKNTIESEFCNHKDNFEKQTFISKIAIYDDNKNLLGIAKLATPVLKKETDSYTFKLKLDF